MAQVKDPIGFMAKMNAGVLYAVTPEYGQIKAKRIAGAGRCEERTHTYAMQTQYKTIEGTKIRYADNGKTNAPTVLMLCPLPQSILCFDPVWAKLDDKYRLVALDLPGFGRSEGGLEFMSFKAQGEFLAKFVKVLDLHNMHVVGPDVGMAAALYYAIHQENDIASLIIGDGPGILPSANGSIISKAVDWAFWRMVFVVTGSQTFVEGAYRLACLNYIPHADEVADYVASYDGRIGPITYWFKTYPENLATTDPYLDMLQIPVQLFWGDMDIFLTTDNAERLNQRLPKSQLKIFDNCGHFSYQDKADEFAQMLSDWVDNGYTEV